MRPNWLRSVAFTCDTTHLVRSAQMRHHAHAGARKSFQSSSLQPTDCATHDFENASPALRIGFVSSFLFAPRVTMELPNQEFFIP
jgi:hypothetical protein